MAAALRLYFCLCLFLSFDLLFLLLSFDFCLLVLGEFLWTRCIAFEILVEVFLSLRITFLLTGVSLLVPVAAVLVSEVSNCR